MDASKKTRGQLIAELASLHTRVAELETSVQADAAAALRASELKYRRLFEAAKDGILILDAGSGEITAVNPFLTALLGYGESDMLGKALWEIGAFADIKLSQAAFKELQEHAYIRYDNLPLRTRSGRSVAVEFVSNVYLADGKKVVQCNIRDITERSESEARSRLLSAALSAVPNAVVITDSAGRIEWVNPAFSKVTGYAAEEAVGKNPRDLVRSGHHDPAFYKLLWDRIMSGQVWRGEMINRRRDGSFYTEDQTITPMRDARGKISHFIAVKEDVTERNRTAEEANQRSRDMELHAAVGLALAETEGLAQALAACAELLVAHLEVAAVEIWIVNDRDQVLERMASAGVASVGDGRRLRVGLDRIPLSSVARDRKVFATNAINAIHAGPGQEWRGREGIVAFAGQPLVADGRTLGLLTVYARRALPRTVSEVLGTVADHMALGIRHAESATALRMAEERLRFALTSANVGVWDLNYATGTLFWSENVEAHYGIRAGTFARTFEAFIERVHPDDRASVIATIKEAEATGGDFTVDHRAAWPDGSLRSVAGAGRVICDEAGSPIRAIGITMDVTERRLLEAQYQQAQKMEAIGRLAGGIAHDFNNLLTVILGFCELLLSDLSPVDPRRVDVVEIHTAATRAAGLTRQLLAFSRKQIIEPTLLDLNAVVSDIRPMLGRLIGDDVTVEVRLHAGLAPVLADRGQAEQVVMNLAVNARDAMPRGGTVTIATSEVDVDENYAALHIPLEPGPYVVLTVADTGIGMTPEVQAHLFEPFFTTKAPGKGTGLGLATVHGIATACRGTVHVYSEVGKGTSLSVYLPRAQGADILAEQSSLSARLTGNGELILVVDDAEGLRELAKKLLERQGYRVLAAANTDEALELFEANPSIDVLLTDVIMPGPSGSDLARLLLERRATLRVIYMSGYTDESFIRDEAFTSGIAFLHKPFTSDSLGRKVREVLDRPPG